MKQNGGESFDKNLSPGFRLILSILFRYMTWTMKLPMVFEGEVFPQLVSQPPEFHARRSAKPPADLGRGRVKVLVKHSSEQFVIVEAMPCQDFRNAVLCRDQITQNM